MENQQNTYDLLVIGGGINGTGIAADAAGRGLKVLLCEQNDLASGTSSASSKLIHGGLRYLEQYEFSMVKASLQEREVLINIAPHLIRPLQFVLPHLPHLRPTWMIRAGLFLYDHLARRVSLPGSKKIKFDSSSALKKTIKQGFSYYDAWADDARLVMLNALSARKNGADIRNYTQCQQLIRSDTCWQAVLKTAQGEQTIRAKAVVNAAGPWASQFLNQQEISSDYQLRLIKGSHFVVPKIYQGEHAYILQNEDNRIVFVLPFEQHFSLIGTTDIEYQGDPSQVEISDEETDYLINIVNQYFDKQIAHSDIKHAFSGVRGLIESQLQGQTPANKSAQDVSRDYKLVLDTEQGQAPLMNVLGGKLTIYRVLSEKVVNSLVPFFTDVGPSSTANTPLPGGHFKDKHQLMQDIQTQYPWLDHATVNRFSENYGSLTFDILGSMSSIKEMGQHFGAGLFAIEVDYLISQEWARSSEDILWRRTKLKLLQEHINVKALECYIAEYSQAPTSGQTDPDPISTEKNV